MSETPETADPMRYWTINAVLLAAFLLALFLIYKGLTEPGISIKALFSSQKLSILDGIDRFREDGQTALAIFILIVSVIFPLGKIFLSMLLLLALTPYGKVTIWITAVLSFFSKWSMTDVFILAVMVLVIDGRVLTAANLGPGAWYFLSGVILSTALSQIMLYRSRRIRREREEMA